MKLRRPQSRIHLAAGEGIFLERSSGLTGSGMAWLFEAATADHPLVDHPAVSVVLSRRTELEPQSLIVRAERIESQARAVTPRHRHRGPGIRRLLRGLLLAEVGNEIERVSPGMAWFESGDEIVVGRNISDGINAFVRVMLLPGDLLGGKTSFIPATHEDALKPRAVSLHLFGELPIR